MEFADIPLRKVQVQFGEMHLVGLQGKSVSIEFRRQFVMKFKIERNWSNLKTQKRNLSLFRRPQSSFKSMGADILSEAYNENRIFTGLQQACAICIF